MTPKQKLSPNSERKFLSLRLKALDSAAKRFKAASSLLIPPAVISFSTMKDRSPTRIVS